MRIASSIRHHDSAFRALRSGPIAWLAGRVAASVLLVALVVGGANAQPEPPPDGPPPDGPPPGRHSEPGDRAGGGPEGPPGMSRSSSVTLSGAYTLNGGTAKTEKQTYTSDKPDVSAIYAKNGGVLTLTNPSITTTGNTSSNENSSFYGLNAAVVAGKGSKITISGGSVTTSGRGANGVFATGKGAEVTLSRMTIKATGSGAHGVMATQGGTMILRDVDISTSRDRAGAIATDRGGGKITVTNGTVKTAGTGSPGIYSTGDITVTGGTFTATGAEAVVIEGSNSVTLTKTALTGAVRCGVMIYQSFSGDAQGRKGTFTMTGGSLTAKTGPLFYVTNTTAVIKLTDVRTTSSTNKVVDAGANRWGRSGSNGGKVLLTAETQNLTGDLTCDKLSSITATLRKNTTLTGMVNSAALTIDATSNWIVTADSVVTGLTMDGAPSVAITRIQGNGHDVRYDASLTANRWLDGKTYDLPGGGRLLPNH